MVAVAVSGREAREPPLELASRVCAAPSARKGTRTAQTTSDAVVVALAERKINFVPSAANLVAGGALRHAVPRPPTLPVSQWLFPREALPPPFWTQARQAGAGLRNPSSLCFMNSVLQALAYTPGFAEHLIEGRHSRVCPVAQARRAAARLRRLDDAQSETKQTQARAASEQESRNAREEDARGPTTHSSQGRQREQSSGASDSDKARVSFAFCVLCKLEEQIRLLHRHGGGRVENRFSACVKQFVWKSFRPQRQEDAHEFLRFLLDALIRVREAGSAPLSSPAKKEAPPELWMTSLCGQLFGGWLQSSIRCSRCPYTSVRFDPCLDVPLDLGRNRDNAGPRSKKAQKRVQKLGGHRRHATAGEGVCTLEKALYRFVQKEHLDGDNCYK
ncbi:ubiquitin carboxyl-terminal hydrolase [Toxoplasma gondii TgCatPRC2]|uniref:ubiquitinyl hydrolase 1 n=1 Tax=Toxoplasma gondii TgCatPRC2 TaxID=1130821 RepID=A0A151HIV0_TOXGO|nr:ubiquitin carboxyl-terminal hydrolase [Toxoplasma gondii TgCatPRC2]